MKTIYRKAKPDDQKEIFALEKFVWGSEVTNWYDLAMFIRYGFCFVAKNGNRVVGCIYAFVTADNRVYINDWVVHPNYQSKGIGRALYLKLFKATPGRTLISLIDTKNRRSLKAHDALGFKRTKVLNDPYKQKEYDRAVIDHPRRVLVKRKNGA